jgi:hypothetical protein
MNGEKAMTNPEDRDAPPGATVIRHSSLSFDSSFGLRHSSFSFGDHTGAGLRLTQAAAYTFSRAI